MVPLAIEGVSTTYQPSCCRGSVVCVASTYIVALPEQNLKRLGCLLLATTGSLLDSANSLLSGSVTHIRVSFWRYMR